MSSISLKFARWISVASPDIVDVYCSRQGGGSYRGPGFIIYLLIFLIATIDK